MNEKDRQYFIYKILDTWVSISDERRPWGVWIVEHEPLAEDSDSLTTDVKNSWFLSEDGIIQKGPWSYVRYQLVKSGKFWHAGIYPPPTSIGDERLKSEIGTSGFAEYKSSGDFYLEWLFGATFGRGYRYSRDAKGVLIRTDLWVS